jgi:hypothetical protein
VGKKSQNDKLLFQSNMSDYDVPSVIFDTLQGEQNQYWIPSAIQEIMNLIKIKCWKKVPKRLPK